VTIRWRGRRARQGEIASRRDEIATAVQIPSIYQKLGVPSRRELLALFT
jgi:hypothetical protein